MSIVAGLAVACSSIVVAAGPAGAATEPCSSAWSDTYFTAKAPYRWYDTQAHVYRLTAFTYVRCHSNVGQIYLGGTIQYGSTMRRNASTHVYNTNYASHDITITCPSGTHSYRNNAPFTWYNFNGTLGYASHEVSPSVTFTCP